MNMSRLRFLTIEFMDGKTERYSFPAQTDNKAVRQVKLESFFKDRYLILHGEGKLNVFPVENIKSIQLSSDEGELEGVRIPAHTILGARRIT
jgi:hypothetical protein